MPTTIRGPSFRSRHLRPRSYSAARTAVSTAPRMAASSGRRSALAACRSDYSTTSTCGRTRRVATPSARAGQRDADARRGGRPGLDRGPRRRRLGRGLRWDDHRAGLLHKRLLVPGALHPHLALHGRRRQLSDRDHALGHDERCGLLPRPPGHRPQHRRHPLRQRQPEPLAEHGRRQQLAHPVALRQYRRHRRRAEQRQLRSDRRWQQGLRLDQRARRHCRPALGSDIHRHHAQPAAAQRSAGRVRSERPNGPLRGARRPQRRCRQRRPRIPDQRRGHGLDRYLARPRRPVQRPRPGWQQQPDRDLRRHRLRRHPLGRRRRLLVHLGRHPLPARAGLRPRAEERAAARRHLRARRLRVHQAPGSLDRSQPRERLGVRDRLPRTAVADTADLQRRPE